MTFTLPTDIATDVVDDSSVVDAAYYNGISAMGNAIKAAVATWGFNPQSATVATSESTSSGTFTDLTTTTDSVTAAIGSSGKALVMIQAKLGRATAVNVGSVMGYALSGADTVAATDAKSVAYYNLDSTVSATFLEEGLTPGFTTFKLKYRSASGSGTFSNRRITVIPLPATDGTHASGAFALDASSSVALGMSGAGVNRPTYDSVGAGYKSGGDTGSWSHVIGADAKALLATVFCTNSTAAAVTVDGTPMTKLATQLTVTTGGTQYVYVFGMLNPPTGTKTIAVTGAAGYLIGNSVAYTNVVGFGAVQTNTGAGTSVTQTVQPTTPGRIFFQAFGTFGNAALASYSGNERWSGYTAGSAYPLTVGDVGVSSMGAITITATNGNTNGFGGVAVELMPSVPTYSVPTWVGTGLGAHHKPNPGFSWVETVPADANLALVWVSEMPSDQINTCTVTLGGTSMVEVTGSPWLWDYPNGTYERIRCFALQSPSTGPGKTIAITSNVNYYFHAHSVYYGGVTSVSPPTAIAKGPSGTPTLTIPNSSSSHLYAQAFSSRPADTASTFTASSGRLRAVHDNGNGGYTVPLAVVDAYGNDSSLTVTATRNSGTYWGGVTLDLSPAALPTPSTATFIGVGSGRPHLNGNYSWTETVPANATCAILWVSALGNTPVSATLGGQAMTHVTGSPFTFYSGNYSVQALYLLNPTTGGGKTLALTNSIGYVYPNVMYYGGVVAIGNPTAVTNGAAGQQPQIAVANTDPDHLYANAMVFRASAGWDGFTAYDQNWRFDGWNWSYDVPIIVGDAVGNGGTLTFNGTRNNTSYEWGGVVVDLS